MGQVFYATHVLFSIIKWDVITDIRDVAADCVIRMRGDSTRSHSIDDDRGSYRHSALTHPTSERKKDSRLTENYFQKIIISFLKKIKLDSYSYEFRKRLINKSNDHLGLHSKTSSPRKILLDIIR